MCPTDKPFDQAASHIHAFLAPVAVKLYLLDADALAAHHGGHPVVYLVCNIRRVEIETIIYHIQRLMRDEDRGHYLYIVGQRLVEAQGGHGCHLVVADGVHIKQVQVDTPYLMFL